jgi:hypothetical protein
MGAILPASMDDHTHLRDGSGRGGYLGGSRPVGGIDDYAIPGSDDLGHSLPLDEDDGRGTRDFSRTGGNPDGHLQAHNEGERSTAASTRRRIEKTLLFEGLPEAASDKDVSFPVRELLHYPLNLTNFIADYIRTRNCLTVASIRIGPDPDSSTTI